MKDQIGIEFDAFCDESCHLEHDQSKFMVIGGVWCPHSSSKTIAREIKQIKEKHNANGEIKWTKVSRSKDGFYHDLLSFFFQRKDLNFRCIVVENKEALNHEAFNLGSHDTFYYKMYYYMLRNILKIGNTYNIYMDVKDTRSALRVTGLKEILCNSIHDFEGKTIQKIQSIRSLDSQLLQLADFLIGAVSYTNRQLTTNATKLGLIQRLKYLTSHDLMHSTPPWSDKFNLFLFTPTQTKKTE